MYKERISALLKVIQATKIVKEDNIPCKIEEVFKYEILVYF